MFAAEPTHRFLWLWAIVGAVGVLSAVLPLLEEFAFVSFGILLAVSILDYILAGDPDTIDVRRGTMRRSNLHERTPVSLRVSAPRVRQVSITDTLPEAASERHLTFHFHIAPKTKTEQSHDVVFRERGRFEFGKLAVRTFGMFGLVRRRIRKTVPSSITIHPNIVEAGQTARRFLSDQPRHGSQERPQRHDGREFESLREFQRGDDRRYIEWKVSARKMQWITKKLQPEQKQDVLIMLDHGRQMAGTLRRHGESTRRLEYAVDASLHLCATALLKQDRVGFLSFADHISSYVMPQHGQRHLAACGEATVRCQALPVESDFRLALGFIQSKVQKRSWIAIFSDVLDKESAQTFVRASALMRKKHRVTFFAVGDPALISMTKQQPTSSSYKAAMRLLSHRQQGLAAIASTGVQVVDLSLAASTTVVMNTYARMKSSGQL